VWPEYVCESFPLHVGSPRNPCNEYVTPFTCSTLHVSTRPKLITRPSAGDTYATTATVFISRSTQMWVNKASTYDSKFYQNYMHSALDVTHYNPTAFIFFTQKPLYSNYRVYHLKHNLHYKYLCRFTGGINIRKQKIYS
jgi:hypothetical protein